MKKRIKILHLENSLSDSKLVHSLIENEGIGNDYFLANNEKDFINIIETENIDIILSDCILPKYNGNDALKVAREKYPHMPFIFVSNALGEDAVIKAMLNGATNYVLKNKLERLAPAIKRAVNEHDLDIESKQAEMILRESERKYKELAFQNEEKSKRAEELIVANKELAFQNEEKEKRADELIIANKELAFQNEEKEKRADELIIANKELAFQNEEKEKRADELIIANKELAFQNEEKEKRADELIIANKELAFQNEEKEKRADELIVANKELAFQNEEKEKRANELGIANKELVFQNEEKEKRAAELIIADKELAFQNEEKGKRAQELGVANKELVFQDEEKEKRAAELIIANKELAFQNAEKGKRAQELGIANVELAFQNEEKGKRAEELGIANVELAIQNEEKVKLAVELIIVEEAKSKAERAAQIAEDTVKAKQQFLSNMSHEIRTPMNAIIGFTKVLLKTDLSAKQKEYLTAIKMSGDTLTVLINDILDLAKVDSGKMIFEKTPFKIATSIAAMIHVFETKIQEKNLQLIKEYDNKIPMVLAGDPVRLHQIILNLVSNAIKFTTEGIITVSVQLLNEDEEKATIKFAITDTGIGIAEDKIEHIFDNFQQATNETSRLYGGTGLGLAIAKQLVERQNGTIIVKSKLGEGSTFSFILPFQKTKAEAELETELKIFDVEVKNIKVLVVEDVTLNQLLMETLLDDFGFDHDIAGNGKIAIEKLKNKQYDIILMDLQMPEMNGFQATEYIRNILNSQIPIIALTADVTTVDFQKCKAVGMNDYLSKPINERLLYNKMIDLLKRPVLIKNAANKEKVDIQSFEPQGRSKYADLTYLTNLTKANPEMKLKIIENYLEDTLPLINNMKISFLDKDWDELYTIVHKMIPSFFIMGIHKDFENMAKKIQEYAKNRVNLDELQDLILQLENVCFQTCAELKEEYNLIKKA